jgi:exopolysaccharide biosynthesis protein
MYKKYRFCETSVHVVKIKKEKLQFELVLAKDTVRKVNDLKDSIISINAGYYNVKTLNPIFGFSIKNNLVNPVNGLPFVCVSGNGQLKISEIPLEGLDYFQVGPLLIKDGILNEDFSFFRSNELCFDEYIDFRPNPRTALGYDEEFYYFVVVDGRSQDSRGLYLLELAAFVKGVLNATHGINLDGGSSSTLIYKNKLLNTPSGNSGKNILLGTEKKVGTVLRGSIIE